jgi:hypothetical protein
MSNFYVRLDVTSHASRATIKNAYQRLLRRYQQNEDIGCEFKLIQEAYDTLSDPKKRRLYDIYLLGSGAAHYLRFEREGLRFALITNPQKCNYYDYVSAVFRLPDKEKLIPGMNPPSIFWEKLDYVAFRMYERENYLARFPKLNEKQKAELKVIDLNTNFMSGIFSVFFGCRETKRFYDLSLGIVHNSEMAEVEKLIGGRDELVKHIKKDPEIDITLGVLALKKAHLLNAQNFLRLSQSNGALISISLVLEDLEKAGILTQSNFELLLQHEKHALAYENGLNRMSRVGLINQKLYEVLIHTNHAAGEVGTAFEQLSALGIFNELNWQVIAYKIPRTNIWEPLRKMKEEGFFTQEDSEALMWDEPEELHLLAHAIGEMFAHGLFVLNSDYEKGKEAMALAFSLKKELKTFFESEPQEREISKNQFKDSFLKTLHSKDKIMSSHRAQWKMIVVNIAIALTGVGLFALGVNYLCSGHAFFAKTKRQEYIDKIEHSLNIQ